MVNNEKLSGEEIFEILFNNTNISKSIEDFLLRARKEQVNSDSKVEKERVNKISNPLIYHAKRFKTIGEKYYSIANLEVELVAGILEYFKDNSAVGVCTEIRNLIMAKDFERASVIILANIRDKYCSETNDTLASFPFEFLKTKTVELMIFLNEEREQEERLILERQKREQIERLEKQQVELQKELQRLYNS